MGSKLSPVTVVVRGVDKITGTVNKVTAGINKMNRPVRNLEKAFQGLNRAAGFSKIASAVGNVGAEFRKLAFRATAAGGAVAFAASRGMNSFIQKADQLEEAATAAGVGIEQLQELRFAGARGGIAQGSLDQMLRTFSTNLGKAKLGGGPLDALLGKNAPALLKQLKGAKSAGEALDVFFDAAARAKNPALRSALLAAGFGRSGGLFGPVLEGLAATREEARTTGNVMSADLVRRIAEAAGEFDRVGENARGAANVFFSELLPTVTKLAKQVNAWVSANRALVAVKMTEFARNVARIVEVIADNLPGAIEKVRAFVDAIGGWKVVLAGLVAIQLGPFISSVWALTAALAVNPVGQIALAVAALVGLLVLAVKYWDELKERVTTFGGFSQMVGGAVPVIGPALSVGRSAWDLGASKLLEQLRPQAAPAPQGLIRIQAEGSLPLRLKEMRSKDLDLEFLGPLMSAQ